VSFAPDQALVTFSPYVFKVLNVPESGERHVRIKLTGYVELRREASAGGERYDPGELKAIIP
jgi:hypothetical protein